MSTSKNTAANSDNTADSLVKVDANIKKESWFVQHGELIQRFAAVLGLALLIIAFSILSENFRTVDNALTIFLQSSSIALLGIGVTYVIITSGIDLSVGSILALSGVTCGLTITAGAPVWVGFLVGLLTGTFIGFLNSALVNWVGLPPFIATLGMMMIAGGLALQLTGAQSITIQSAETRSSFGILGNGALFQTPDGAEYTVDGGKTYHPLADDDDPPENAEIRLVNGFRGIPYPVIVVIILATLFAYVLKHSRLGRYLYAIGSNEEAARLSGVNVVWIKAQAYMISGFFAGLAGIVIASRLVTVQPNAGLGYEMYAIAAAVIGGTSLMGGVGTISGTIIGALIIGVLRNGLNMTHVKDFVQQIIIGSVIIIAVAIDHLRHRNKA